MIDNEIINAFGLSVSFIGVILSIVSIGIIFVTSRISEQSKKEIIKLGFLLVSWSVFIILNSFFNVGTETNNPIFLEYSFTHIFIILFGIIIVLTSLLMYYNNHFSNLSKKFNEDLLVITITAAFVSLIEKIVFPFFWNPVLSLITQIIMVIPLILGFFMIILNVIRKE
jgi:hypothetical protein|tara:strand:- start:218 stop:724 length:507 start_codon:yes stop_codon:yes gene_type:complete